MSQVAISYHLAFRADDSGKDRRTDGQDLIIKDRIFYSQDLIIIPNRFIRSTQTFIFPIHLSEEIIPAAVFYATVTPLCVFFVVKKLVIEPMNDEKRQRKIDKTKEVNRERMAAKKKEAESSIDLMSATFARIREDETKNHGLIIELATYGQTEAEDDERFDVTVPLQCLVRNSQLNLHATPKSELPGFYDPCVGEDKTLRVKFTYRDQSHSIEITDKESLHLPGRSPGLIPPKTTIGN